MCPGPPALPASMSAGPSPACSEQEGEPAAERSGGMPEDEPEGQAGAAVGGGGGGSGRASAGAMAPTGRSTGEDTRPGSAAPLDCGGPQGDARVARLMCPRVDRCASKVPGRRVTLHSGHVKEEPTSITAAVAGVSGGTGTPGPPWSAVSGERGGESLEPGTLPSDAPAAPRAVAIRWAQGWSPARGGGAEDSAQPRVGANPQRTRACASAHGTDTGRPIARPRRRRRMAQRTTAMAADQGRRARSLDSAAERGPSDGRGAEEPTEAGCAARAAEGEASPRGRRRRGRAQPARRIAGARHPPCFL